jgi:phosphoribosylformylglycinamidine synthase
VVLLGEGLGELGGSEYLKAMHGLIRGVPPSLDLDREAALQRVLVSGVAEGLIRSAHDCAEGGLAITLAESCFDTGLGVDVDVAASASPAVGFEAIATLFGESASRVVVSATMARVAELLAAARAAGVPATPIGRVGGTRIRIAVDGRVQIDERLETAEREWSTAVDRRFARSRAIA